MFLRLMCPNCLAPSHVVLSEPGLEFFLKESNKVGLFILNFLPLILGVLSNMTPDGTHGNPCVTQSVLKRNVEFNPRQEVFDCLVLLTLELVSIKADPTIKIMDANGVWLEQVTPAKCIKVIFTPLVGLRV